MELGKLKKFARETRVKLIRQVGSRLDWVLSHDDGYIRAHASEKDAILERLELIGRERLVEEVAYTWFNRVAALRYMDNRNMNPVRIVSPAEGQSQIELLSSIKRGMVPEGLEAQREEIFALLDGRVKTDQPDREVYKTALLGWCNHLGGVMPFLFKKVEDWAALLLPTDLISAESFIAYIQMGVRPEDCGNVEIIGWLYQFYISEKKDLVFEGLRKNRKIAPENIPAATQLFTPHWIVRYMTENSLGRLWLLNRPESGLVDKMEYYIPPEELETEFLSIQGPEEIRVCDPACGSGHMLVYAFDLLYEMYAEEGYDPSEIPEQILRNNLFGIEIDERAGELAAFALAMKARERDRRFFRRGVQPHVQVLQRVDVSGFSSLNIIVRELAGGDINAKDLQYDLELFAQADNFGSLLRPRLDAPQLRTVLERLKSFTASLASPGLEETELLARCAAALKQAEALAETYHVVIANPPYMGGKGMNPELSTWAKKEYPESKSDLFAMFIERGFELVQKKGYSSMVTMQSWMFLSSYEKLRIKLLSTVTIECMVHMANMVMGIAFGTAATVWKKELKPLYRGAFCYVEYEDIGEDKKPREFPPLNKRNLAAKK